MCVVIGHCSMDGDACVVLVVAPLNWCKCGAFRPRTQVLDGVPVFFGAWKKRGQGSVESETRDFFRGAPTGTRALLHGGERARCRFSAAALV